MILKMRKIIQKKVKAWGPLLLCTCFSCMKYLVLQGRKYFFAIVMSLSLALMWHISQISTLKWTVTKKIYKRKFFSFYWFTLLSRLTSISETSELYLLLFLISLLIIIITIISLFLYTETLILFIPF